MSDTDDTPTYAQNIKLNSLGELERAVKAYKAENPQAHLVSDDNPWDRTVGVTDEPSLIRWYVPLTRLRDEPLASDEFRLLFKSENRQTATAAYFNQ